MAKKPRTIDPRGSAAYRRIEERAKEYVKNPARMAELAARAAERARAMSPGPLQGSWAYFTAMIRLIKAYVSGKYRKIPTQALFSIVLAVLYVVSPLDFIPDALPGIGLVDDAFVLSLVLRSVRDELDAFLAWEVGQSSIPPEAPAGDPSPVTPSGDPSDEEGEGAR